MVSTPIYKFTLSLNRPLKWTSGKRSHLCHEVGGHAGLWWNEFLLQHRSTFLKPRRDCAVSNHVQHVAVSALHPGHVLTALAYRRHSDNALATNQIRQRTWSWLRHTLRWRSVQWMELELRQVVIEIEPYDDVSVVVVLWNPQSYGCRCFCILVNSLKSHQLVSRHIWQIGWQPTLSVPNLGVNYPNCVMSCFFY